jgi:hypothetical protein
MTVVLCRGLRRRLPASGAKTAIPAKGPPTEVGDVLYKGVLLLEDNKKNQRVATELLESAGVIVTLANHGGVVKP